MWNIIKLHLQAALLQELTLPFPNIVIGAVSTVSISTMSDVRFLFKRLTVECCDPVFIYDLAVGGRCLIANNEHVSMNNFDSIRLLLREAYQGEFISLKVYNPALNSVELKARLIGVSSFF